jgi:hypothetical protein
VSITFTPAAAGTRAGNVSFANPGGASVVVALTGLGADVTPPPAVVDVTPGAGTAGIDVLGVVITGNSFAHFAVDSEVDFGEGITVSNVRNASPSSLTVDLSIAADAVPGVRTVTVSTLFEGDTEVASLSPGFVVVASTDRSIASVTPAWGAQGQTLDVAVVGSGTHFKQGVTSADFGDGVTVTAMTVQDQTHAVVSVSVSPTAMPGWRTVRLVTGGEFATIEPAGSSGPGFNVVAGDAALESINPATGVQGAAPFSVTVIGAGTHFQSGASCRSEGVLASGKSRSSALPS